MVCPSLWWCCEQGSCLVSCFCSPHLRSWQPFRISLFIICPNCACRQFLVPYSFFVFCCWRRDLSRCKHSSKGSQVPACLTVAFEEPLWCQGFCLKPLSAATRQLFNHPGALSQALGQMETVKLFAAKKKKAENILDISSIKLYY